MMDIYSFVLVRGLPYAWPYQPSTTWGPDGPKPSKKRLSDSAFNEMAVIAVMAGVLACICMIAVPTFIFEV